MSTLCAIHCEGAYCHDLRKQVCYGWHNRHYRIDQYLHRSADNYPTHDIGPIAKLPDIYYGKYEHPLWVDCQPGKEGHSGIDSLQFDDLFRALEAGEEMPIDVCDMATWMATTVSK